MRYDDYLGISGATAFGLWYVLFPKSVIRFNRWFYGRFGSAGISFSPKESQVRWGGTLWLVLVLTVWYFELR